jgi:hypothetical protein
MEIQIQIDGVDSELGKALLERTGRLFDERSDKKQQEESNV